MKSLVFAIALAALACVPSRAQIISLGQCSEHPVVQNFDVEAYLGDWYEISRYEQVFQRQGDCVKASYSLYEDGSVRVENRMLLPNSGKFDIEVGRAVLSFPDEDPLQAKLNVSFFNAPPLQSNYWVLDTDYESFAFVWSCFEVSDTIKGENFWLLSREKQLDESVQARVDELIDQYLIRRHIRRTRHDTFFCVELDNPTTTDGTAPPTEPESTTPAPVTTDETATEDSPKQHAKERSKRL